VSPNCSKHLFAKKRLLTSMDTTRSTRTTYLLVQEVSQITNEDIRNNVALSLDIDALRGEIHISQTHMS
jgi:hypothetical protein